ncbi:MAG: hypothetical protein ACRDN9_06615 [Streptosporangiaceae bacterium]
MHVQPSAASAEDRRTHLDTLADVLSNRGFWTSVVHPIERVPSLRVTNPRAAGRVTQVLSAEGVDD